MKVFTEKSAELGLRFFTDKVRINGTQKLAYNQAGELLAEDLRQAQTCLSEITGTFTSDDLLERIFRSFCIGK